MCVGIHICPYGFNAIASAQHAGLVVVIIKWKTKIRNMKIKKK